MAPLSNTGAMFAVLKHNAGIRNDFYQSVAGLSTPGPFPNLDHKLEKQLL
jgi:hypothetical protein